MNIQEYFSRISFDGSRKDADLQTLTAIFQHHIQAIPFENLSMHCGETIDLDLQSTYNKIVKKKRGGWCMETNYLLFWALKEMGYDVCVLGGNSYDPAKKAYIDQINHILLKVVIKGSSYIVDAGFGGGPYQTWLPMLLISGKDQPQIPGIFRFTEDSGIWYLEKVKRKHYVPEGSVPFSDTPEMGNIRKLYSFTLEPKHIDDFQELNTYLQVCPDTILQKKSICSLQTTEGFYALVGWTFSEMKYKYKEDTDLLQTTTLTDEEIAETLKEKFNIVLENKLIPVNVRGLPSNLDHHLPHPSNEGDRLHKERITNSYVTSRSSQVTTAAVEALKGSKRFFVCQDGSFRTSVEHGKTQPANTLATACTRRKRDMNLEEYFARTGYKGSLENQDLETLTDIFQHHIRAVPFENLSIHCGEKITLELEHVYNKIVHKKRGGWCMENNQLLGWVLKCLGYDASFLGAYVFNPHENAYATIMTHLLVKVVIEGKAYIVDAGFGVSYQMWQPMELVSGKDQPQAPGIFRFTEKNAIWYLEKMRRKQHIPNQNFSNSDLLEKKDCRKVYMFSLEPRTVEDFCFQCTYLQTSPESLFTKKSICTLQTTDGFRALIGWTLTETKYNYKENMDLVEFITLKDEEVEKTLKDKFNITLERKLVPINIKGFYTI